VLRWNCINDKFTYASKDQLKDMRGCFHAPRIDISCKFEGEIVVSYNARPSLIFYQDGVVQLAGAIICDFTPLYKLVLAFADICILNVHKG
jgi:hypothetical protein